MFRQWWNYVTESPYAYAFSRRSAGRLMAGIYAAAGVFDCVATGWTPVSTTAREAIFVIGIIALLIGLVTWFVPWNALPRWLILLIMAPVTEALIAAHNYFAHDPYRYTLYFIISYVWIGLTQRQGMSALMLPITAAAYLCPLWLLPHPGAGAIPSA